MKVFLSSTCYDLKDLRASIESYLIKHRHVPVLSDKDSFSVNPKIHRHDICLENISNSDLFIIVIDHRFGAEYYKDKSISISMAEYRHAIKNNIDILAFVRESVFTERLTYIKNKDLLGFCPAHVDDIRTFEFISEIQKEPQGIWMQPFHDVVNIINLLSGIFESREKTAAYIIRQPIASQQKGKKSEVIYSSNLSDVAKVYITKVGQLKESYVFDEIELLISYIPIKTKTIGTLLDFEIDDFGIKGYTQAITVRPMDDDGSSWFCIEVPTALGESVYNELFNLISHE